jgi:hypothetical protein
MEISDLIKKLENTDVPEIELKSHKAGLRFALLNPDYFKKTGFWDSFKRFYVFALPTVAVFLIIVGFTIIRPKMTQAKALGIAKENSEIKKLIEENNMTLGDIKVKDGKAYILLNSSGNMSPVNEKNPGVKLKDIGQNASDSIEGAIVEVNLKNKKVDRINSISGNDINPLSNAEKESVRTLISEDKIIGDFIPKEAKIGEVQSSLSEKIDLIEENDKIKAVSQTKDNKRAHIDYTLGWKKWVVEVNLDKKAVEEIRYSAGDNDNKKVDENLKGRD